ncbi:EcsC family protein [Aerosakkonemataceae cyanobacterium BLCC-F154]|uniref:EcsC family protein n=1 Tax=Floridaenema fluviatile BLCC-F154 TaxID=3153640 RepID=A0ABV4YGW8_9CYAN
MEQQNLSELAKQGNAQAIATFMNRPLQPKGITVKAVMKNDCLQILLEAAQVPNQQVLVPLINKWMSNLGAESIKKVKVFGRQAGEEFPAWNEEFEVSAQNVPNFEELAKQGDINALTKLINQWMNSQSITVKAILKNDCLQIKVESAQVPEQDSVVLVIREGLIGLGIQFCQKVKIFGQQTGDDFPDWQEEFELNKQVDSTLITPEIVVEDLSSAAIVNVEPASQLTVKKQPSSWGGWLGAVRGAAGTVGGAAVTASQAVAATASQAGKNALDKATEVGGAITNTASQTSKIVAEKASGVGGAIANTASQTSKIVVEKATEVGSAITNTASQTSEIVIKKASDVVTPVVDATGKTIQTAREFSTEWLVRFIDNVDVEKAETKVRKLQQKYPNENPDEIAHRLMVDKAFLAGGAGLVSKLIPGTALALAGLDLAATTALSAELIYQVAAAYGLDLDSSERKGEILTIFSLSLSGGLAIDAGVTLLGNIPVAGAVIGASSNAALLYTLGYASCRFYEAKLTPTITMEATLETAQLESQKFLKGAISQQVIMDQILIHVYLAGNPGKTWEEILPELETLNLSPASLETIAANSNSPPSLESLLAQINSDFAVPLLAQCEKVAQLDGVITPEESQVIETITRKFNINLEAITL